MILKVCHICWSLTAYTRLLPHWAQLEWVCDDAYKLAVGQSFFFIGSVLGTIFFGYLADRIGRLKACMLTTLTGALGDFTTSFVSSLPFFSAGRFMAGLSTDTQYILMYILGGS